MLDFRFEEDVEQAVAVLEAALGKQGRMLPNGRNVMYSAKVLGPHGTVLWYGDIDTKEDGPKISQVAAHLGTGLGVRSEFSKETQLYPIFVDALRA